MFGVKNYITIQPKQIPRDNTALWCSAIHPSRAMMGQVPQTAINQFWDINFFGDITDTHVWIQNPGVLWLQSDKDILMVYSPLKGLP